LDCATPWGARAMRPGSFRNGRPTLAVIIRCFFRVFWHSGGGEGGVIGRRTSLRSWRREACGFESHTSHQNHDSKRQKRRITIGDVESQDPIRKWQTGKPCKASSGEGR